MKNLKQVSIWCVFILFLSACFFAVRLDASSDSSTYLPIISRPLPYPLWALTLHGTEGVSGRSIVEAADGDFIIVGSSGASNTGYITRVTRQGTIRWQNRYPGVKLDHSNARGTTDGGLIALGFEYDGDTIQNGIALKINGDGGLNWARTFEDERTARMNDVVQTDDGGFLIAGYLGWVAPWIFKLNPDGSVAWQRQYSPGTELISLAKTSDNGAVVVGVTADDEAFVMRIAADGTIDWQRSYGEGVFEAVTEASDSGYVVVGNLGSISEPFRVGWIVKIDNDGLIDWQYKYGNSFHTVALSGNGGYLVGGSGWTEPHGREGILLSVDSNGQVNWGKRFIGGYFESLINANSGGFAAAGFYYDSILAVRVNDDGESLNCDLIESVTPQAVATNVTVGLTSMPSTVSAIGSYITQPTILSGDLVATKICPSSSSAIPYLSATETGCQHIKPNALLNSNWEE